MRKEKGKGGFTLLELLISMTIIGLITVIIFGALRLGFRSVERGEKRIESLERFRASLSIIDSQIQSHIPVTFDEEGVKKYYFKGEKEFLQFLTNYSIWGGQKGYVLVAYSVISDTSEKKALYASENILGMENRGETKLFEAFDGIYFEYFYKDPTEEEGRWVEQWTDEENIPAKIRFHLVTGEKDFSFIIPLRVKGSLTEIPQT